jgi:hypothetical protein
LNNNTNADPIMIAGQKAFATSFILVSLHSPTNVGFLYGPPAPGIDSDDVDEVKICSDLNRSNHALLVASGSLIRVLVFRG